jgi:hypothetical protein
MIGVKLNKEKSGKTWINWEGKPGGKIGKT